MSGLTLKALNNPFRLIYSPLNDFKNTVSTFMIVVTDTPLSL